MLASTSTFVSCKDYSDEISDLQTQINNANALHATKAELATAKAELTAAYEKADAELKAAIDKVDQATKDNAAAIAKEVEDRAAAVKVLEAKIAALEEADKKLEGLIKDLDEKKVDKTVFDQTVTEIYAKITAVETELGDKLAKAVEKLEAKDKDLDAAINGVAADLIEAQTVLQANIDKVDEKAELNKKAIAALDEQLQIQKKALEDFKAEVAKTYATKAELADAKKDLEDKIEAAKKELNDKIDALAKRVTTNENDIKTLKKDVEDIKKEIEKINKELVSLNLLIKTSLRSLVFIPDSYYWGIEATEINYLEYNAYEVTKADVKVADDIEKMGGTEVRGHVHGGKVTEGSKVLSFAANYHINPASANLDGAKYALVTADKAYVRSATEADALLSIVGTPTASKGILNVQLDAAKPELIKSVPVNQAVTIFATEVTLPASQQTDAKDVKVTSDYATLYRSNIKDLVLGYKTDKMPSIKNGHCGPCAYYKFNSGEETFEGNHLFANEEELVAAVKDEGQYYCDYDKTMDLTTIIETHYTDENGTHMLMTPEKLEACGLKYKFELVGLERGSNNTSESVHAAINPEDGKTFRPQEAQLVVDGNEKGYEQKAYGAKQSRETINRTPVVRVSLVDAVDGTVYDYGYVMIRITEFKENPSEETLKPVTITYTGKDIAYASTCTADPFNLEKYWNNIEYDILKTILKDYSMSKEEFDAVYENDGHLVTKGDAVAQFELKDGAWVEKAKYVGTVVDRYDAGNEQTSTLKWTVSGEEIVNAYIKKGAGSYDGFETAVMYKSKDIKAYPDIVIILKSGKVNVTVPTANAFVKTENKIDEYWYKNNGNSAADGAKDHAGEATYYAEIHAQTISPEDSQAKATAEDLDDMFSDVFVGNKIGLSEYIENGNKDKYYTSLVFSDLNKGAKFNGYIGTKVTEFTLDLDGDYTLVAYTKADKSDKQVVAKITTPMTDGKVDINKQVIEYVHGTYSEAMLNYARHNALADNVLKAVIEMKVKTDCLDIAVSDKTFNVRFLRPINVDPNDKALEDAQDKAQTIELRDLINLSDWREYKFADHLNYWNYYNIKSIKVVGASTDGLINAYVTTTMNGANFGKTQAEVSNQVLFKVFYKTPADKTKDSYGFIEYQNLSSTVQTFTVDVPVQVEYEWGVINTNVKVEIKNTHENAKLR